MTRPTRHRWSTIALWSSVALNVWAVLQELLTQAYGSAGVQSALVSLVVTVAWLLPKLDAWSTAAIGEAEAKRDTAALVLTQMQRVQESVTQIRVRVDRDRRKTSMN
jgi:hypothetical protein